MTVREELERAEHGRLSPLAAFADQSRGRLRFEEPREEDVRTCYQRDIDRIVHSKAFLRGTALPEPVHRRGELPRAV